MISHDNLSDFLTAVPWWNGGSCPAWIWNFIVFSNWILSSLPSNSFIFRYILTGIIAWGIDCGKAGVPGVYGSVQKALCFIDFATKCKHRRKYNNFYNYREHCKNWIDEEIEAMRERKEGKQILKAQALKDSCISLNLPRQWVL